MLYPIEWVILTETHNLNSRKGAQALHCRFSQKKALELAKPKKDNVAGRPWPKFLKRKKQA